jgi:hypothetical protein
MKRTLLSALLILLLLKIAVIHTGCANIIPPAGGPKDTLPPVLVKATPPDSSKEFKAKTITLTFDEYIQLDNISENINISPTPVIPPRIESKLKTITIKINDTLEPNTTYYYNFGKAIKDINEGNVLENFSYIFTTGTSIDSLELAGKVLLAETGGTDSSLIAILHRNGEDSAVIKETPRYIAKLNGKGEFRFRFLPPGIYYVYALRDDKKTRKYDDPSQLFAFADQPVNLQPGSRFDSIILYASASEKKAAAAPAPLTVSQTAAKRTEDNRLKFTTSLVNNQQSLISDFSFSFDQPLKKLNSSGLQLSTDSTFIPVNNYSWQLDSLRKKLYLKTTWKENTRYHLILDKEFAEDSAGHKLLKTDTLHFTTKKLTDYGSVRISFSNLDLSRNPILQFVVGGQVIYTYPITTVSFFQPLVEPGEYELRYFYDENKNGQWDPGNFWQNRRQPEIIRSLEKKITVKANWENELEIKIIR